MPRRKYRLRARPTTVEHLLDALERTKRVACRALEDFGDCHPSEDTLPPCLGAPGDHLGRDSRVGLDFGDVPNAELKRGRAETGVAERAGPAAVLEELFAAPGG